MAVAALVTLSSSLARPCWWGVEVEPLPQTLPPPPPSRGVCGSWAVAIHPVPSPSFPLPPGQPGTPLAFASSGELHALTPLTADSTTAVGEETAEEKVSELAALASNGGSRLASVFGTSGLPSATRAALDKLTAITSNESQTVLSAIPDGTVAVGGDTGGITGWEGKAIDEWWEREISNIPSHLLPPVTSIFRHVIHQALRPATHLQSPNGPGGGGVSNLRKAVRAVIA